MTAQEAKQRLERIWKDYTSAHDTVSVEDLMAFDMATNALGAIEQIQWERDMAIKQLHDLGYGLGEKPREDNSSSDKLIKASDAVDVVAKHSALYGDGEVSTDEGETLLYGIMSEIMNLPSAQPESTRTFVELVVKYPDPELCTYKEYKGKPYYSIKYIENGEIYVGYGTYSPKVMSRYLREYFIEPEQTRTQMSLANCISRQALELCAMIEDDGR